MARSRGSVRPRTLSTGQRVWDVVYELPRGLDGRRRKKWIRGLPSKRAAHVRLTDDLDGGGFVEPTNQTVREYMREWLRGHRTAVRPSTWTSYTHNLENHVFPRLGRVPLTRLTGTALTGLYADLLEGGRMQGKGGLSPRTVRYVHSIVRKALADAFRQGLIQRNVADQARPPSSRVTKSSKMRTWTADELRRFLEAAREDSWYPAWLLAATTGMRRGEVLALRWRDVDLTAGSILVRRSILAVGYRIVHSTTKTGRTWSVALDPGTAKVLREHRKRQLEHRVAMGAGYEDGDLVFAEEDGSLLHPDRFTRRFARIMKAANLPPIRLHDLRHTHATLALAAGVHPKIVSERLGHSTVSLTFDVYSHAIPALESEAAAKIAALFLGESAPPEP